MYRKFILLIFNSILFLTNLHGQDFEIEKSKNKFSIPFQHVGNLVILPISINGSIPLNFVLDTGSPYTIITNLNAIQHFQLRKGKRISVSGLGRDIQTIEAYSSKENTIQLGKAVSNHTDIVLIFEEGFDLSGRFGIPIYGIIGYDILKDFIVEINYGKHKVIFYEPNFFHKKKELRKYNALPIEIKGKKPFLQLNAQIAGNEVDLQLLVDTGSTDALWLFEKEKVQIPNNHIEDYLGYGLNGEIHGKKTRISNLKLGAYELKNLTTSFPDSISVSNVIRNNRNGTVGSEVLRRFNTIYDYQEKKLWIKKNRFFKEEFHYNLAGLELYQPYADLPYLEVAYIRKGSPADLAGLKKGDAIRLVNDKRISVFKVNSFEEKYDPQKTDVILIEGKKRDPISLPEIIDLFKSDEGRAIEIVYTRGTNDVKRYANFKLKKSI
ncbi:aspartyl protease family protein [Moheibacter lacus]|uniref:Aspartyl protease family protein n=1 Tax=Moheibacter lacus TaxID=2745851 RepID=A0A838ZLX6_9FLAO|nr:aspartyl protease family protein [Moheibacter lacus]MBA5629504.1 aspartyl protease family protein [Moheibacter lacus]